MAGLKQKNKIIFFVLIAAVVAGLSAWYLSRANIPILEPAGTIGEKQRNLIVFALGLSLIVVIPVYILLFSFAWRYREGNREADTFEKPFANSFARAIPYSRSSLSEPLFGTQTVILINS